MENRGLLFIPDISGFTRFVTETEVNHSRRIIEELLEVVIDANRIGLEVSEIEGDAILFFRFGASPDLEQLCGQVEHMFRAFHERLAAYEIRRFCQCRACLSASHLTLKVITHYGEFTSYSVRQFEKLIGKDVIVAHQLLKNDIDQDEYWLVTPELLADHADPELPGWIDWRRGVKQTERGEIRFHYAPLGELRRSIEPAPLPDLDLSERTRMFAASREYDAHIITMFHATGDFTYRDRWQEGVRRVEEVDHHLPRVGMRCRRIMDDGTEVAYASSYAFRPDRIEFSETDEGRNSEWHFILEGLDTTRTRLTVEFYLPKGRMRGLLFNMRKRRRMEASLNRSLLNLVELVREIDVPVDY